MGASPLYLTLIATIVFYAVAMVRRILHASTGLTAALAVLLIGARFGGAFALAIAAAAAHGYFVGNRWYFAVVLGIFGGWLATAGWHAYRHLRQTMAGLGQIAWGVVFFLLAIIVSLTKTGIPRRWLAWRQKQN